jgi:putative nucleotidyltransferase with HDIG domain
MRDKETEGHTQRVTILTQRLAHSMRVSDEEMVHITRGALLHDIGKMAISDTILLKPGKLTEAERSLMQKHPEYAYDMLKRIEFLLPAIHIPYCHHEKWDGTGYPRGLKGEEIPFAARIFPVIDVYDALVSNRPYRKGIPVDQVKDMIRKDSGTHFDPHVVEAFLAMEDLSV